MTSHRTVCRATADEQYASTPTKPPAGRHTTKTTPAPVPEGLACARSLLDAAERLHATGGRAPADLTNADLQRLLRTASRAETALDRAVLAVLGAARERQVPWWRIGKALEVSEGGARALFNRACERHPDYTAPLAPTLAAHLSHAGDLVDAIADPPQGFSRHAAARLLGAVLLTATLEDTPELVAHWLADPALSGAAAAAARHPKNADACNALADFARERPGTRADLLDICREAVRATPWALGAATGAQAGDGPPALSAAAVDTDADAPAPALPLAPRQILRSLLRRVESHDDDPAHQALRALAEAIDTGDPARLDGPMREVAALENAERIRLLGPEGAHLWERLHRDWADADEKTTADAAAAVAAAGWPAETAGPVAELADAVHLLALHLPDHQSAEARALVAAVADADGPTLAAAVAALRELDAPTRAQLLGAEGQRALENLPPVPAGPRPASGPTPDTGAGPVPAELVAAAGLPAQAAAPLAALRTAAAPHLARTGPTRWPIVDALAQLDRAVRERDPHALAAAFHALPDGGVDLFDATNLAGVGDALAAVLMARGDHVPAASETEPEPPTDVAATLARAGLAPEAAAPLEALAGAVRGVLADLHPLDFNRQVLAHLLEVLDGGEADALTGAVREVADTVAEDLAEVAGEAAAAAWADLARALGLDQDTGPAQEGGAPSAEQPPTAPDGPGAVVDESWTSHDAAALAAIEGGAALLASAVDRGGDLTGQQAGTATLRALLRAELMDTGGRITDRGRAALARLEQHQATTRAKDWSGRALAVVPDSPALAAALARLIESLGGDSGVQNLSMLAKDQRTYLALWHLVRTVDTGNRARFSAALDDVLSINPGRAPLGKRHQAGAEALRALIHAYDNQ